MIRLALPRARALALVLFVVPLASCATATNPDVGEIDAGTHDTSIGVDTGSGGGDTKSDGPVDAPCLAPKKVCGGVCTDITSDNDNCGDCGKACGETASCVAGACGAVGCTKDQVSCPDGKCANLLTDPDHCGDCSTKCGLDGSGTPKICKDATCQLDCTSKTPCPGGATCVDLTSDDANCGACGHACPTGQKCAASTCIACPTTGTICGAKCVDTSTDSANCGGCGKACPTGETCSAGVCVCPTGLSDCSGVCKDLMNDGTNCGTCGHACATGLVCNSGSCSSTCPTGKSACGGSCIDTTGDPLNCGGCGVKCGATAPYCSGGTCVSAPKCNAGPYNVLFYGDVDSGAVEKPYLPTGSTTTIASGTTWSSMTTADFAKYQLIVIGEGGSLSTPGPWDNANATKGTWGPAISGRIVVHTMDATVHASYGKTDAATFARAALLWAATGPGTNLYVGPDFGSRKYDFLSTFGSWSELGQPSPDNFYGDSVHILLPTHGTVIGETDTSMSNWSYTFHGGITSAPSGFVTVAQGTSAGGSSTPTASILVARDATCVP